MGGPSCKAVFAFFLNHYMSPIIFTRKGIPFFHSKTPLEFQQDVYERYDEMVVRQSALHLADALWDCYPFKSVFDFAESHYPDKDKGHILEIGCGVGRWIATLAKSYPTAHCWGIDYSYQMLKRAKEYWKDGADILIDLTARGLPLQSLQGERIDNLDFGLAKAESLPFDDNSQDLVVSSFLLDRLEKPKKGLEEMYRVLKPNRKIIIVTPLNFSRSDHWKLYYPASQLSSIIEEIGFEILDWQEDVEIRVPLDYHGSAVVWSCLAVVGRKLL